MPLRLGVLCTLCVLGLGGREATAQPAQEPAAPQAVAANDLQSAIDKLGDVPNCGVTEYRFDPAAGKDGGLVLAAYNVTAPLVEDSTPVTAAPDAMVAARG